MEFQSNIADSLPLTPSLSPLGIGEGRFDSQPRGGGYSLTSATDLSLTSPALP